MNKNMLKAIGWLVLNIALQFIVQLACSIYAVTSGIQDDNAINDWLMVRLLPTVILSNLLFFVIAMLIYKRNKRNRKDEWKCNNIEVKSYLLPCVIGIGTYRRRAVVQGYHDEYIENRFSYIVFNNSYGVSLDMV